MMMCIIHQRCLLTAKLLYSYLGAFYGCKLHIVLVSLFWSQDRDNLLALFFSEIFIQYCTC